MSDPARRNVALTASVFGFTFLMALFPMRCLDTWWHMANGREMVQGRGIPTVNTYSFTFPEYETAHPHWLFALGAYLVHAVGGVDGLVLVKAVLVGVTFLLCYLLALRRGAHPALAAAFVALAALDARTRFLERPHLFTMLGLVGFAWIMHLSKEGRPRLVWIIPPLAALWANLHAGVLFGIGLVGIDAFGALTSWGLARARGGADDERAAALRSRAASMCPVAFASALAVMIAPTGWHIYAYNLWHVNLDQVIELLEFRAALPHEYPFFYLVLVASVAALALDREHATPEAVLTVAFFGALGVYAVRGVPNFLLVASPLAAPGLTRAWRARGARPSLAKVDAALHRVPIEVVSALLILMPFVAHALGGPWGKYRIGLGTARSFFPEEAARFVAEHVPARRAFNDLSAGGYLAWHWYPRRRIFVDGRTNAYPPGFFRNLYRDAPNPASLDLQMRTWGLDAALLHFYRGRNRFWPHFDLDRWAVVFADDASVVLLLRSARNRSVIEKHEGALGAHGFRALSDKLAVLGESHIRRAIVAADRALGASGRFRPFTGRQRALLLRRSALGLRYAGDFEASIARYREAISLAPDVPSIRTNLAWVLLDAGEYETARAEFERALREGPAHPEALLGLARALARSGDRAEAESILRQLVGNEAVPQDLKQNAREQLDHD